VSKSNKAPAARNGMGPNNSSCASTITPAPGTVQDALAALAKCLAPLVAAELQGASANVSWIDQTHSQLGARKHINAVRALVAKGSPDARIVCRRHLLTAAAHEAELLRVGTRAVERAADAEDSDADLGDELGLRLVGVKR